MKTPTHRHRQPLTTKDRSTAERIVASARRHFLTHGFRHVTMDDLARELGMSKKTLYASFQSKTLLLEAVIVDKFRQVEQDLDSITAGCSSDVLASLQELLACMQQHTDEIKPPFVRDMQRESPERFKMVEVRQRMSSSVVSENLLTAGRKVGIIRKDVPTNLILEILLSALQAIMNPPKIVEWGLAPKSGYSAIVTVILEGVMTDRARAAL